MTIEIRARQVCDRLLASIAEAADPVPALARCWPRIPAGVRSWKLLATGKASMDMARYAVERLDDALDAGVVTAVPELVGAIDPRVRVLPADHPLPTARNLDAALAAQDLVGRVEADETLLLLISGGGSAHLTSPAPGLTLDDLRRMTSALQRAGARIEELNAVRKHCERLKGGRMAALCRGSIEAFVLSDVMGDRLDVISSGPAAPDPTTYHDAFEALGRHGLVDAVPAVTKHLHAGAAGTHAETPKFGDACFTRVRHTIIASNATVVAAAAGALRGEGFTVDQVRMGVQGEAGARGREFGAATAILPARCAIVWGGETTVSVGNAAGRGGPSQEFALAAALALTNGVGTLVLAYSTDGVDGPTDAAGAVVTDQTVKEAGRLGLDLASAMVGHDSYTTLNRMGCLLQTGPTGTNVNHVMIGICL